MDSRLKLRICTIKHTPLCIRCILILKSLKRTPNILRVVSTYTKSNILIFYLVNNLLYTNK